MSWYVPGFIEAYYAVFVCLKSMEGYSFLRGHSQGRSGKEGRSVRCGKDLGELRKGKLR